MSVLKSCASPRASVVVVSNECPESDGPGTGFIRDGWECSIFVERKLGAWGKSFFCFVEGIAEPKKEPCPKNERKEEKKEERVKNKKREDIKKSPNLDAC